MRLQTVVGPDLRVPRSNNVKTSVKAKAFYKIEISLLRVIDTDVLNDLFRVKRERPSVHASCC